MYGNRLKKFRKDRGLTLQGLEKKIDTPNSTLSYWENSDYPPLEGIEKVCKTLDIPLWKFFAPDDEQSPLLTEKQKEWLFLFEQFPPKLQIRILRVTKEILEGWIEGKEGKK